MTTTEITTPQGCIQREDHDRLLAIRTERTTEEAKASFREVLKNIFKAEAQEGTMSREDALELANKICDAAGITPIDSIATKFIVSVSAFSNHVMDVEVEADSDEEACEMVEQDMEIDDVELNFTLNSQGDSGYGSTDDNSYAIDLTSLIQENLDYSAEEVE
jgi:hypothetical protein